MLRCGFFFVECCWPLQERKKNPPTHDGFPFFPGWPLSRDLNETAQGGRIFPDKFLSRYNWEKCAPKVCPQTNKKGTIFQGKKGGLNYCLFFRGREAFLLFIFDLGRLMGCFFSFFSLPVAKLGARVQCPKRQNALLGGEGVYTHAVGQLQEGWLHRHETPTTTQKV